MTEDPTAPWPLMTVAIEPKTKADREKLGVALAKLATEEPSFRVSTDPESGLTTFGGISDLELGLAVENLKRTYGVDVHVGAPQVAYRETLTRPADIDHTYKTLKGGASQFARVRMHVEPNDLGGGFSFVSKIGGGAALEAYVAGVEAGVRSAMEAGVVGGFPVVDIEITLMDVACHETDSSVQAFKIASRAGFREALLKGGAALLEPIMKVAVVTPENHTGSVIGDLRARRGEIRDQITRGESVVIQALVPLSNMFGYVNTLRSMTNGRSTFEMQYARYKPVEAPDGLQPPPAAAAALRG